MAAAAPVAMVVGTGLNVWANLSEASAKSDQANADAAMKREQANELEEKGARKAELMGEQRDQLIGAEIAANASSGAGAGGTTLLQLEKTHAQANRDIFEMQQDVAFRAKQLREGANVSADLADTYTTVGAIRAGGTILSGAGQAYNAMSPNTSSVQTLRTP